MMETVNMGKTFRRNDSHRLRGGKLKNKQFRKLKEFEDRKHFKPDIRPGDNYRAPVPELDME